MNGGGNVPKIKIYGLDKLEEHLYMMARETEQAIGKGIYAGADILADSIKSSIQSIRTSGPSRWEKKRREKQKQGLLDSFGIAPMQKDKGYYNVKLGFDGYNDVKSRKHPNGQPNAMIARMYNSGTSVLSKQAFFERGVRSARNLAKSKATEVIEKEIEKLIKE